VVPGHGLRDLPQLQNLGRPEPVVRVGPHVHSPVPRSDRPPCIVGARASAPPCSCILLEPRMARLDQNHPIAAVLTGALDRFRVRRTLPALAPDERLDGKLALVTGGASGLGFATSVDLGRRGARVLLADCRDLERAHRRAVSLGVPRTGSSRCTSTSPISTRSTAPSWPSPVAARGSIGWFSSRHRPDGGAGDAPGARRDVRRQLPLLLRPGHAPARRGLGATRSPGRRRAARHLRLLRGAPMERGPRARAPGRSSGRLPRRVLAWYGTYKLMLTTFAWELARRLQVEGPRGWRCMRSAPGRCAPTSHASCRRPCAPPSVS